MIAVSRRHRGDAAAPFITTGLHESDVLGGSSVFLRPGDWIFGRGAVRVSTLLGSCVSLALWSPRQRLGAMCHCLLPTRPSRTAEDGFDGRYAEETFDWLQARFREAGCELHDLQVSLAGGAGARRGSIGQSNVAWTQQWAQAQGLDFEQQDVGGHVLRRLNFNLADGCLTVAHGGRFGGD